MAQIQLLPLCQLLFYIAEESSPQRTRHQCYVRTYLLQTCVELLLVKARLYVYCHSVSQRQQNQHEQASTNERWQLTQRGGSRLQHPPALVQNLCSAEHLNHRLVRHADEFCFTSLCRTACGEHHSYAVCLVGRLYGTLVLAEFSYCLPHGKVLRMTVTRLASLYPVGNSQYVLQRCTYRTGCVHQHHIFKLRLLQDVA